LLPVGGGGGSNASDQKTNSIAPAVGASLGVLAVVGVIGFLLFLWKRRSGVEDIIEPMTEFSEADTDSTFDGDEDLFVSEYGFSDKHGDDAGDGEGDGEDPDAGFSGGDEGFDNSGDLSNGSLGPDADNEVGDGDGDDIGEGLEE
jgi:hypothetical protein